MTDHGCSQFVHLGLRKLDCFRGIGKGRRVGIAHIDLRADCIRCLGGRGSDDALGVTLLRDGKLLLCRGERPLKIFAGAAVPITTNRGVSAPCTGSWDRHATCHIHQVGAGDARAVRCVHHNHVPDRGRVGVTRANHFEGSSSRRRCV